MAKEHVRPLNDRDFAEEMERLIAEARGEVSALGGADTRNEIDLSGLQELGEKTSSQPGMQATGATAPGNQPPTTTPIQPRSEGDDSDALSSAAISVTPSPPPSVDSSEFMAALARIERELAYQRSALGSLPEILRILEEKRKSERTHEKLFDALHEELRSYKDSFLFDSLQKPFIKDLLSLHDDIAGATHRVACARNDFAEGRLDHAGILEALETASENLANLMHFLVEILTRLDVIKGPASEGPVDLERHRIIDTHPAEDPAWDGDIAESVRPGFRWRDRVLRPEDVVIYRYQGGRVSEANPGNAPHDSDDGSPEQCA